MNCMKEAMPAAPFVNVHTKEGSRASDCVKCVKCEHICPQHLPIRDLLTEVAKEFDK